MKAIFSVLCDRGILIRATGNVHKRVVRPPLLYGSECWAITMNNKQRMCVTEMKMLRWAGGIKDDIQNESIRGAFKVAPINKKLGRK